MYFLAEDIERFEPGRFQLDDSLRTGQVDIAFRMFDVYQNRATQRLDFVLKSLETEPDFSLDEEYEYDRTDASWAKSDAELNELWRKRVKNDAISLMLTDKTWEEARDVLAKRYERAAKRSEQVTSDDVFENFMNSFASVFDPHSNYFSPRNSEEYRIQMSLSYEGIGASLQSIDDYVTIMEILPGGSAQQNGELKAQDRILAVGQGKDGKMVSIRVPYPLGFYAKGFDGRIDDAKAGWKGRGLWAANGDRTPWLIEGGKGTKPLAAHFQMRPDPLAK